MVLVRLSRWMHSKGHEQLSWVRLKERPPTLWLGVIKQTLALCLLLVLIFSDRFAETLPYPTALNGAVLVIVGAYPGGTMGKCFEALLLGSVGFGLGVLVYAILGEVADSPTGQGFIFSIWVYLAALVRFGGPKYISFYLYGVLFSFNGIYGSITEGGFNKQFFLANAVAYLWGMAISLGVNLIVWPFTAEAELRQLLVTSLQHVSTLAHLTCKTYARELNQDEVDVRQVLVKALRSDYLALNGRLDETSFEITFSRWSLKHYRDMIKAVQGLQQALITSSSAIDLISALDPRGINSRHLLARSEAAKTFADFRHGIDLVIAEIIDELVGPVAIDVEPDAEMALQNETMAERQTSGQSQAPATVDPDEQLGHALHTTPTPTAAQEKMMTVAARLKKEVLESEQRHRRIREESLRSASASRRGDNSNASSRPGTPGNSNLPSPRDSMTDLPRGRSDRRPLDDTAIPGEARRPSDIPATTTDPKKAEETHTDVVQIFRKAWDAFARAQQDALVSLIKDGSIQVDDFLRIEEGMPSIKEMYAHRLPKAWTSSLISQTPLARLRSHDGISPATTVVEDGAEDAPCSDALTKAYSLLFGLGQLTEELAILSMIVRVNQRKKLRPYLFHMLLDRVKKFWGPKEDLNLQEALATLHGVEYKPVKKPFVQKIARVERWFWQQRSIYAAKVAMATTVYSVFALAPTLQQRVFLRIGQVSALITVIVAVAPTLGGTLSTWLLQVSGTGAGALVGLIVLEIFHNVGGYTYNPYGLVTFGALWYAWSSYKFLRHPAKYTQSLLYVTGYSAMVIQEHLYNDDPSVRRPFDSPGLRFGFTIASLGISMAISAVFQLFVFRQPARRRLRLQLADILFALSSYNTMLQCFVNLVAPADEAPVPRREALAKVQRELIKRESKIQASILALAPTFQFAKVEPKWWAPFKADTLLKIIRTQQVILDRLREARTAVGMKGFNPTIHHDFANVLFPYRLHSQRLARTLFYLGATSLISKTQLARDVPSSKPTWVSFEHDALVLSRRMSRLPRGERELKRPGFLRYWFYLVSLGSVSTELEELEKHLGELFGDPDISNPYIS
ncbi:transmembrane protein [Rhodotorula toruloides]|uniref:Transmembrane protein n=1 Tax=Rhodotorula toruloides TaxID=5286 RepID=A0A511K869_RHOTO|nr:transmembrane protein [Rhodotorula toruloides]